MSPDVQLIIGCLGLGLAVGYAWWVRVRTDLFRDDLVDIRARLDEAMIAKSLTGNLDYLQLRRAIDVFIQAAPYSSPTVLFANRLRMGRRGVAFGEITRFSDELPTEVFDALGETIKRLLTYALLECLSGWPILFVLPWLVLTGRLRSMSLPAQLVRLAVQHPGRSSLRGTTP